MPSNRSRFARYVAFVVAGVGGCVGRIESRGFDGYEGSAGSGGALIGNGEGSNSTGAKPAPGIYDTPSVCTSDSYWTHGDDESPKMHPGRACIACHSGSSGEDEEEAEEEEGPRFWLAGTVYPSAHEPDECNGVDGGSSDTRVVIVDANGQTLTLNVNSAGNFYYEMAEGNLALPYVAKVVRDGRERAMATRQTDGDCNGCHTEQGDNHAPARIMAP